MTGAAKRTQTAVAAANDVRAALRSAIAGIEASFNSIEKMQPRTRLSLALSLLDGLSQTSAKFANYSKVRTGRARSHEGPGN